jgi:mono/diheme cytochrome c family protein
MRTRSLGFSLILPTLALIAGCNSEPQEQVSYKTDIKPLIDKHCGECHTNNGKGTKASGFSIDNYGALMKGTKYGPVIIAGDPLSSTLYRLVSGKTDASIQMPHGKEPLTSKEISKIEQWISQGAKNI